MAFFAKGLAELSNTGLRTLRWGISGGGWVSCPSRRFLRVISPSFCSVGVTGLRVGLDMTRMVIGYLISLSASKALGFPFRPLHRQKSCLTHTQRGKKRMAGDPNMVCQDWNSCEASGTALHGESLASNTYYPGCGCWVGEARRLGLICGGDGPQAYRVPNVEAESTLPQKPCGNCLVGG